MDPYDENRLRNEVIYLHHLWHQGPPNPTPQNPTPSPIPYNTPQPLPSFHHSSPPWPHQYTLNPRPPYPFLPNRIHPTPLQPRNSTPFKRKKKKTKKRKGPENRNQPDPAMTSCSEWPVPVPAPTVSGWPPLEPRVTPATPPVIAEEKEMLEALKVQYKARQACKEFLFGCNDDDDDDDGNDVEDEEDDVDDDDDEEIGDFFTKLFAENNELRKYYQKCCEGGAFRCLVCGVVDHKNCGKRFHDCVGLVQHAMTISRTKTRRAHRAFGNAVCEVLGWDVNRLPTVVMKMEVKPADAEGEPKENAGDGKDGSESSDKSDDKLSVEHLGERVKQDAEVGHETCNQVSESFSKEDDLNKNAENLDEKISDARSDKEDGTDKASHESPVSDVEWSGKSPNHGVSSAGSAWPAFNTQSASSAQSLSSEEKENLAVLQLQHKALEACHDFLVGNVGKKVWKRFKDCSSLLQHSTAILRTKRKRAHRAYAQVICKVLGWDFDRLPAIVSKGEPLGSSMAGSEKLCDEPEKSAVDHTGEVKSTSDINSGEDHDDDHRNSDL
ncbi:uncharacterized protein G2W53_011502 [Senna tora]|uniref:Uncharacterized protein n=1 Tax=Senna tora TaxID=362788 RepID=A0A834X1V8_9FABA|nr:uncharacterized protein G2W53_011502 [Senna tora]